MTASITDFSHFETLRAGAARDDPAAIREAAGQFEALFVQSLLKNMRAASLADPVFGQSDQHEMYQDMLDKQLSLEMSSGSGIGLADLLVRQLGGRVAEAPTAVRSYGPAMPQGPVRDRQEPDWRQAGDFLRDLWPHARRTAARLKVAPQALVAQAALETGWGQHVMRRGDGVSSHNLFGIKAGSDWTGERVAKLTVEYTDGIAARQVEQFRSYPTIAETFDDFAALLQGQPRYAAVLSSGENVADFARAIAEAGYATDPQYASKIMHVARSATMRDALAKLKTVELQPIITQRVADSR